MSTAPRQPMSPEQYQARAQQADQRFAADRPLSDLPLVRRRGRPARGQNATPMRPRSIKLAPETWAILQAAADRRQTTVNAIIAGLAVEATALQNIDQVIDRLVDEGVIA